MTERSRLRLVVLRVLVLAILVTLFSRLWFLQVYSGATYAKAASANRVREVVTQADRGEVLDAQGRTLVGNRTALVVSVNRSLLNRERDDGKAVLARLAPVVGIAADQLAKTIQPCSKTNRPPTCWNGSPYQPVPVKVYDAQDPRQTQTVLAVEEHREDFPGVTAEFQAIREYPGGTLAAHLLGYLGPIGAERGQPGYEHAASNALVGKSGVEATYDVPLRGADGVQKLLVDKDGNVTGRSGETAPVAGQKLVLSLDARVQKVADDALERGILRARTMRDKRNGGERFKAPAGAVVVMEARTGRVVAMSSYPSYDPTVFQGRLTQQEFEKTFGEQAGSPLTSRATQGLFAPGSTFKVVSTAAAVQSGEASLGGSYFCGSRFKAGTATFRNFDSEAFGTLDLRTALIRSCDTIYYKFGYDLWVRDGGLKPVGPTREAMVTMGKAWGFGSRTGVDLPSESDGRIASREFKKQLYTQMKTVKCERSRKGYPEVPDATRAAYLKELAREFCLDGDRYRAGDAINFSIGQGDTVVTPLQLAAAYAALANGGTLYEPRLGKALLSADGRTVTPIPPTVRGKLPVSAQTLSYIRSALAGVTDPGQRGTARAAFLGFPRDRLVVAGKTGTAEVTGKQDTSWFASYAPADKPEYVVVTMVEQAGTGGTTAAPITREVYEGMYGLKGKAPALVRAAGLPRVRRDGFVVAPGARVPGPAPLVAPAYVYRREQS
ncbi:MAG: penicillin-binding protein 2 [Actinobacteria bacterium]|nr:penicillin-binding protein 2 [Actinomycetota bacterium]MCA1720292.1 penicillin-binding protein 2 [Actinomycetota bacterium]